MICIICSKRLNSEVEIVSTLCGHVFHSDCFLKWIDSSETCPECRKPVSSKDVTKLHIDIDSNDGFGSTTDFETHLNDLKAELEKKDKELESSREEVKELQLLTEVLEKEFDDLISSIKKIA